MLTSAEPFGRDIEFEAEQDNRGGTPGTDFLAMVGRLASPHGGEA